MVGFHAWERLVSIGDGDRDLVNQNSGRRITASRNMVSPCVRRGHLLRSHQGTGRCLSANADVVGHGVIAGNLNG